MRFPEHTEVSDRSGRQRSIALSPGEPQHRRIVPVATRSGSPTRWCRRPVEVRCAAVPLRPEWSAA